MMTEEQQRWLHARRARRWLLFKIGWTAAWLLAAALHVTGFI